MLNLAPLDDSVPGYITMAPAGVWSVSANVAQRPSRVPAMPPELTTRVFWNVHSTGRARATCSA